MSAQEYYNDFPSATSPIFQLFSSAFGHGDNSGEEVLVGSEAAERGQVCQWWVSVYSFRCPCSPFQFFLLHLSFCQANRSIMSLIMNIMLLDEACALKCVLETHHLKDAVCRPYPLSPPSSLCKSHPRQSEERMMPWPCSLKTDLMTKAATSQRQTRQTHVHAATRRMTWAPSRPSLQPQQQSTSPVQDGRLACSSTSQPEDGSRGSPCGSRSGPSIPIKCRAT